MLFLSNERSVTRIYIRRWVWWYIADELYCRVIFNYLLLCWTQTQKNTSPFFRCLSNIQVSDIEKVFWSIFHLFIRVNQRKVWETNTYPSTESRTNEDQLKPSEVFVLLTFFSLSFQYLGTALLYDERNNVENGHLSLSCTVQESAGKSYLWWKRYSCDVIIWLSVGRSTKLKTMMTNRDTS